MARFINHDSLSGTIITRSPRPLVQQPTQQRGRELIAAAANRHRQLCALCANRLARIKLHVDHIAFKRGSTGLRMITQHGGGDQPATSTQRILLVALPIAGYRRLQCDFIYVRADHHIAVAKRRVFSARTPSPALKPRGITCGTPRTGVLTPTAADQG